MEILVKGVMKTMRVEIRNDSVHIEGYVNVVERDSRVLPSPRGNFIERVRAKTFQRALEATDNVDLLLNHNTNRKLGSTKDGNVELWEDNIGLRAIANVNDPEIVELARQKKLTGWSFAFTKIKDDWEDGKDGVQIRYLEEITLPEVSILTVTPAYIATSIETRDDKHIVTEYRNTDEVEFVNEQVIETNSEEEVKTESIDYRMYEYELMLLKMKQTQY